LGFQAERIKAIQKGIEARATLDVFRGTAVNCRVPKTRGTLMTGPKKTVWKKIGIGFGIFVGVLLAAIVILPFVINVDDYRPKIVQIAKEHINGDLELGRLSLSLWNQIKIDVGGFNLKGPDGKSVVAAKDVYFQIPFFSLISGSPVVTLKMQKPEVNVIKDKAGKLNVLQLVKKKDAAAPAPTPSEPSEGGSKPLPKIATQARLGIEMTDAVLVYRDEATKLVSQVNQLNVRAKDLSLSHASDVEVWANIDTKMGKTLTVKGPAKMNLKADPKFENGAFREATAEMTADADGLEILMPGTFEKKPGVAANASGKLKITPELTTIENFLVKFLNAEVKTTGTVRTPASPEGAPPVFAVAFTSNDFSLKPWNALMPSLKDYDLGGTASLSGAADGTSEDLKYKADLAVKALTAKAPHLKAQPVIDARVLVSTDQVDSMSLTMKAPGNDLKVQGKVVSFKKPRVNVNITSTGMDLDQLIDFPKKAEATAAAAQKDAPAGGGKAAEKENLDASLDPLRENEIAIDTVATVKASLPLLKAYGVKMTQVEGDVVFQNLDLDVKKFSMALFDGKAQAKGLVRMRPKMPSYNFSMEVASIDMKQAVTSQLELFKNTVYGTASFQMSGTGASFNPETAKGALSAKGTMKVEKATFASIDIGKMVAGAVTKIINDVGDKVPPLKSTKIPTPQSVESRYETITSDFVIANGLFSAPNFFAKAEKDKGLDLLGDTKVGIKDFGLSANWVIVDNYNLTKLADVTLDSNGVRVERVLAEKGQPVKLPIKVGGTVTAPQFNYTLLPETLGKVALGNIGGAATAKAKAELQKKADAEINKLKTSPQVQDALKGLGKKLFGK